MSADEFTLKGEHVVDQLFDLEPVLEKKVSTRQEGERRRAIARLTKMHASHGHGPEGVTCGGCAHLVKRFTNPGRGYWKCARYGISRSEATDWRKRWPACGAFRAEGRSADLTLAGDREVPGDRPSD